jgi:hypothetical protein
VEQSCKTPPPTNFKPGDYNTVAKVRFYNMYNTYTPSQSAKSILCKYVPSLSTGLCWLCEYRLLGDIAIRRLCKKSTCLGRTSTISKEQYKIRVLLLRNPVRNQFYKVQIKYCKRKVGKHQLQRKLKEYTK